MIGVSVVATIPSSRPLSHGSYCQLIGTSTAPAGASTVSRVRVSSPDALSTGLSAWISSRPVGMVTSASLPFLNWLSTRALMMSPAFEESSSSPHAASRADSTRRMDPMTARARMASLWRTPTL